MFFSSYFIKRGGWVNAWFRPGGRTIYKMSLRCNQAVLPHWLRLTSSIVMQLKQKVKASILYTKLCKYLPRYHVIIKYKFSSRYKKGFGILCQTIYSILKITHVT